MNDEVITDLKQFISVELSQIFAEVATKKDIERIEDRLVRVEDSVDEIRYTIEQSVFPYVAEVDDQVQGHGRRITKLERFKPKAAL
jgi:hypothetical protein